MPALLDTRKTYENRASKKPLITKSLDYKNITEDNLFDLVQKDIILKAFKKFNNYDFFFESQNRARI